jgi:hypothetical protein
MTALLVPEGTQTVTTEPAAPANGGRLRAAWHRIQLAIREMNYASERLVDLRAPGTVDN